MNKLNVTNKTCPICGKDFAVIKGDNTATHNCEDTEIDDNADIHGLV